VCAVVKESDASDGQDCSDMRITWQDFLGLRPSSSLGNSSSVTFFCLVKVPGDTETISSETFSSDGKLDFLVNFAGKYYG